MLNLIYPLAACAIAVPFILLSYDSTIVDYEGQIASVGSEGVTVTYSDKYGEAEKVKLLVEFPENYDIGNTVIIRCEKDFWTWDLNVTILDDETE